MATWLLDTTWAPIGHLAPGFSTWSLGHPQTAGPTLGSWGTREIPKALPVTFLATSGHSELTLKAISILYRYSARPPLLASFAAIIQIYFVVRAQRDFQYVDGLDGPRHQ